MRPPSPEGTPSGKLRGQRSTTRGDCPLFACSFVPLMNLSLLACFVPLMLLKCIICSLFTLLDG